ncbi:ORF6C domain-containing protein [Clostridium algidicarnis]|uniref:ORF6C domain-containing protein n=1 Tax=Clostridium algidicarnis TaxID=37659 RepID=UPI001C0CD4CD|nr:ORF6C domain-containing protein [Clostridium algidicarnis]MBU3226773.1 ORF6C domain-containing protein [Clostridium algidicarnis]MBU3250316.1 ORF6C domain-containing protein [Clostridium algidicarnis]
MNKLESKLSSREVSEMMGVQHPHLLQKIDGINKDLKNQKIDCSKYWLESSYKQVGNGKENREFQITKRGCEFLAHKTTGTKGNLFTDKYMDKFEKMESYIVLEHKKALSPMEILELQFTVVREQGEKIKEVDSKIEALEDNMPLFNVECKELQGLVRKIGTKSLGGYKTPAYNSNSLRGQVYSDIQQQLKREFGVTRYEAIKRSQLDLARQIVTKYKAPVFLQGEIIKFNNQIQF